MTSGKTRGGSATEGEHEAQHHRLLDVERARQREDDPAHQEPDGEMVRRVEAPLDAAGQQNQPDAGHAGEIRRRFDERQRQNVVHPPQTPGARRRRAGKEQDRAGEKGGERKKTRRERADPVAAQRASGAGMAGSSVARRMAPISAIAPRSLSVRWEYIHVLGVLLACAALSAPRARRYIGSSARGPSAQRTSGSPPATAAALIHHEDGSPPAGDVACRTRRRCGRLAGVVAYRNRGATPHPSAYTPPDTALQKSWLYFYPSRTAAPARAFMVFFGNDIAFWEPHQDLAWGFSGDGISVVGIDLRKYLATLPSAEPQRDSAFGPSIAALIARTRQALGADSAPVIIAGHSFGAEVAFWLALHRPPPGLVGVLALNTRATGHLFITPSDWLNKEASGAWSFSAVDAARRIDPRVRIALVRSAKDLFKVHDPEFIAAGGSRLERFEIPMGSHSLTSMLMARPVISRAVRFLTDSASAESCDDCCGPVL